MAYYKCGRVYTTQNSNVVVDTSDGAIANFNTPLSLPLIETKFGVKATQNLNGQSAPYPAGGGVNKFDKDTMVVNGYYIADTDGQAKPDESSACTDYIEITPNTSYYIKSEQTVGQWAAWYDENKEYISGFTVYNRVITAPATAKYIRLTILRSGSGNIDTFSLNYPSTDTAYHPYSNICPINGWDEITLKCAKKNFVDNSHISDENYWELVAYDTFIFPLDLPKNATLTISGQHTFPAGQAPYVYLYEKQPDGTWKSILNFWQNQQNLLPYSFTTKNTEYRLWAYNAVVSINTIDWLQIEAGTDASDYEEYSEPVTEVIDLGGTYYGGYVTQDKNGKRQFKVTHKKYVFDGTEQWSRFSDTSKWFTLVLEDALYSDNITIMSDKFVGKTSGGGSVYNEDFDVWLQNISAYPRLYICDSSATQKSNIQALTNGASVVYPLAEPFTVALPDGEPIKSFPGINNIFCDTGDISLQFRKIG